MNRRDGIWDDVHEGDYVLDQNGKWWRVEVCAGFNPATGNIEWWLQDKDGKDVKVGPPAGRPVTYLYEPERLVERVLDGTEVS